jgi:hypothetical protein
MKVLVIATGLLGCCLVPVPLHAQVNFTVKEREVQIHGYFSEGYVSSTDNNYLRMETSQGSPFTEAGLNISSHLTSKLRVGAQVYDRYLGELGKGRIRLDWALVDYRLKDWMGFRGGKMKTPLGLHTDTQDQAFLHTWALLPQSLYPVDLRGSTIGHIGADVYGLVPLMRAGEFAYTAFAGKRPEDPEGGYAYGLSTFNHYTSYAGNQQGADLRWFTPVQGLVAGVSFLNQQIVGVGTRVSNGAPHREESKKDQTTQVYGQYALKGFRVDAETRRYIRQQQLVFLNRMVNSDTHGWYLSAAQRLNGHLEVGGYVSRYVHNSRLAHSLPNNHIYDNVLTARVDIARYFVVKVEGHFMDGYGAQDSIRGFYSQNNKAGLKPKTNMLVLRTGVNF